MKFLFAMACAVTLLGCSHSDSKQPVAVEPTKQPPKPSPARGIQSGPVEITQRDQKRNPLWTIRGESSSLIYQENQQASGSLEGVTASIFQEGAVSSTLRAKHGEADQIKNLLRLTGDVTITSTSKERKATLVASEVVYSGVRKMIEASGDVRIETPDYSAGPFPKLIATPDLKQFGTPDRFPSS